MTQPPDMPPPPPPAPGQQPLSESDAKMWAMLAHISGLVITVIGPLIIMLVFGPRSEFVKKQSTEALNFQIVYLIAIIVSSILTIILIGLILLPIVFIVGVVLMIMAGVKSYNGEDYRYPINIRMVK